MQNWSQNMIQITTNKHLISIKFFFPNWTSIEIFFLIFITNKYLLTPWQLFTIWASPICALLNKNVAFTNVCFDSTGIAYGRIWNTTISWVLRILQNTYFWTISSNILVINFVHLTNGNIWSISTISDLQRTEAEEEKQSVFFPMDPRCI